MLPFAYSYITLLLKSSLILTFKVAFKNLSALPLFSKTFFSNGVRGLSIRCSVIGDMNTNWLNSLGVESECRTIANVCCQEKCNCDTKQQLVHILIKPLPRPNFEDLTRKSGLYNNTTHFEECCTLFCKVRVVS